MFSTDPVPLSRRLLKFDEAAEALGIGRTSVYELTRRGELPVVRIGRSARIPAAALDEWVARQAEVAENEAEWLRGKTA